MPVPRPQLSLPQAMKLVSFAAVASACVAPMLRLWWGGAVGGGSAGGLLMVATFGAIVVPLAWAGLSFVLIRRGDARDRWIAALLLCSTSAALTLACWMLIGYTLPAYGNPYDPPEKRVGFSFLLTHASAILALFAGGIFLIRYLVRGQARSRSQP